MNAVQLAGSVILKEFSLRSHLEFPIPCSTRSFETYGINNDRTTRSEIRRYSY